MEGLFFGLPVEIQVMILSYLDPMSLSKTCRYFNQISRSIYLDYSYRSQFSKLEIRRALASPSILPIKIVDLTVYRKSVAFKNQPIINITSTISKLEHGNYKHRHIYSLIIELDMVFLQIEVPTRFLEYFEYLDLTDSLFNECLPDLLTLYCMAKLRSGCMIRDPKYAQNYIRKILDQHRQGYQEACETSNWTYALFHYSYLYLQRYVCSIANWPEFILTINQPSIKIDTVMELCHQQIKVIYPLLCQWIDSFTNNP